MPQVYLNWSIGAWKLYFRRVFLNELGNKKVKLGQTILRLLDVSSLKISNSFNPFFWLNKAALFCRQSTRFSQVLALWTCNFCRCPKCSQFSGKNGHPWPSAYHLRLENMPLICDTFMLLMRDIFL